MASTLNALDGIITSNMAIVPTDQGLDYGKINAYASGTTQLVLDISAYFAPLPTLSITTTSLPGGTINVPYSSTLAATGGEPPYSWSCYGWQFAAGTGIEFGWNDLWDAHGGRNIQLHSAGDRHPSEYGQRNVEHHHPDWVTGHHHDPVACGNRKRSVQRHPRRQWRNATLYVEHHLGHVADRLEPGTAAA